MKDSLSSFVARLRAHCFLITATLSRLAFLPVVLSATMKRSVLLLTLLLTGSVAHAQYGELLNMGANVLLNRAQRKQAATPTQQPAFQNGQGPASQNEQGPGSYSATGIEFFRVTRYNNWEFDKQRSPASAMPPAFRAQLVTLEQRLETCYQLLLTSDTEPLLVGERSEENLQAIINRLQLGGSTWSIVAYRSELALYRRQDPYRRGRKLEQAAAQAAYQRDSIQVAARQRTAAADRLLAASPTTAYLNARYDSERPLQTEPAEEGKVIGTVAAGSLLSVLYRLPETGQCYVCVDGVYGWIEGSDLAPTLSAANELHQEYESTHTKVKPGFVLLHLQQQPALAAVAPSALVKLMEVRAAKKAAYEKAHPEPVEAPVLNNLVYLDADQYLYLNSSHRVSVTYHVRANCPLLRGGKIKRLPFSRIDQIAYPIEMELCDECGYITPGHRRVATASAAHAKPTLGVKATPAKPVAKTRK